MTAALLQSAGLAAVVAGTRIDLRRADLLGRAAGRLAVVAGVGILLIGISGL